MHWGLRPWWCRTQRRVALLCSDARRCEKYSAETFCCVRARCGYERHYWDLAVATSIEARRPVIRASRGTSYHGPSYADWGWRCR